MTYTYLNLVFISLAAGATMLLTRRVSLSPRVVLGAAICLLALTALADNFIVATGIVDYTASNILGIRIGIAPVEDFAYAAVAAVLLPALWNFLGRSKK